MHDFFNQFYFDNTIRDYCISFAIVLFIILVNRIISKYFAGLIFFLVKRIWKNVDKKSFLDLLIHPLGVFVVVFVSMIALHRLKFPGRWNLEIYRYTIKDIFDSLGTSIFIISFIWLLLRMIDFIATILQRRATSPPIRQITS